MSRKKVDNIYPLTPMQEGMLFHSLLDEGSESYFEQMRFTIKGLIDPAILEQSLNALIERHDILRTVFLLEKVQKPRQIVLRERKTKVQVLDITHLSEEEQAAYLEDFAQKDRQASFDLAKDVLIRLTLVRTSADTHTLFWSHHHILLDGWCIPIVLNDFFQIYQQRKGGLPVELGPVYPYSTYISWLGEQDAEEAKASWAEYISGYEPTSFIHKQGGKNSYRQAELVFAIEQALTDSLNKLAKQLHVTLNNLFRAIWGLMLQRQCNTEDVVFGSVVSGRPSHLPNVEQMVGLFINTVPIRVQAGAEQTFSELVKQVQQEALSLAKYHYLSLADIQGNQQLIDHILLFQNYPMDQQFLTRLNQYNEEFTLTHLSAFEQTNYDLNVMVTPSDVITIKYIYNAAVFSEEQLLHISRQLITIMTQVTNAPDILLQKLEVVDPAEKQLQLHSFNDTYRHYPTDKLIHQIFEERAEREPERIALVMGEQVLTYRELNEKANQLAKLLRARGIGPESMVSLLTERSAEMMIAILAIFKAGGAYLPIDPSHPKERIEYILQDSRSELLLVNHRFLGAVDFADRIIDLEAAEIYQGAADNLECVSHANHLAYVIYTSGSTGKPKGVMIEHASLLNIIFALQELYPLLENDAYLLKTTYTFDVSVAEIFGWILGSGRLVILDPGAEKEPAHIWETMVNHGVTHVNFVPSMLIPFVDYVRDQQQESPLRYIFAAGEAMPSELVGKVYEALPGVILENIYGPTESTIYATKYSLAKDSQDVLVPIGKPLANIQTHIVNKHGQLQPVGVPGELCIAGASLARGYWNNEALTNEKFVSHPFAAGQRMYRTGDLARYRQDGNIEYLGRIDHQVKIRGYRIELDEIRAQLIQEASIRDAVVIARTDHNGQAYLCAYFIADKQWTVNALREALRQTLPDYMVPSHFIQLEEFPLTSSGKIDRKALPLPDGRVHTGNVYLAPRNPVEELVVRIWEEVLNVSQVGVHDNFFELGGHSLLATQVLSRTAKLFHVRLPMREIFTHQTVAELARRIQALRHGAEADKHSPIQPSALQRADELPLSYAQQRLWFLDRLIPDSAMYNIPVGFRLRGTVDELVLERALNEIIQRHESLRTTFVDVDGRALQVIHTDVHLSLGVTDLRDKPAAAKDAEWKQMAEEDAATPFRLDQWPLLRAMLIRLEEQESVLWLNVHHIISDGWSMDVLVNELSEVYEALLKGEALPLAALPIQYRDYAVWQREKSQDNVWKEQLRYWKNKLDGSEPLLPLPTDRPRAVVQSYRGDHLSFYVPGEVGQKLRELGRQEGATLFMTLLAAFKSFLYRYTHANDILIGTPVAGRNRQEIENLIGFFVNMLVLRTDLSDDPTFVELLRRVRETAFDAFANEDVPFEKLVDELQIERSLSYSPLFQVLFAVQGMSTGVREGETLAIAPDEVTLNQTTKFDLTLTMIEAADNGLKGVFEYSTDLFDRTTIERMAEHFGNLLQAIAADPGQKIVELPLLGGAEQSRMLVEWNQTDVAYSLDLLVHERVARIAQELPEQFAVIGEQGALTYAQLDAKANQLAHALLKRGIGSEDLVGICVERSSEMLIGQLAILKAGAAYVPMDPAYPRERLAFMIKDAGMSLVLTQERLLDALPQEAAALLCLDRDWQEIAAESTAAPAIKTNADQLAYVIYTSGSTGTPKGVEIEHGSLLNLVNWHQRAYSVSAEDRASQIAGTAFDASVWETWPYLTAGATICQPREEIRLSPEKLRDWLVETGITISFLPTPLAENLLPLPWPTGAALRYMLTGGDTLHQYPTADVPFTLVNQYGPTENTVVATAGAVPVLGERESAPTIGRPIDNVSVYVLDENRQPVPVGVVGELYIGGKSLARGYRNRPDLTEASFVPNPFSPIEGARMYRTGDLVRYAADGSIEFIGRADDQVSIRGFRVELGEIESALYAHPAVAESVVIVREDVTPGVKRLVAYVVLHEGEERQTSELRQSLKEMLPDYMVPSAIVLMEALPLTPNGKVDRRALPLPDVAKTEWEGSFVEPQSDVERKLAEIWQEVLGVETIGVHDNFFELGGDSILTIQIVSRANQAGLQLTPKHLFDAQTLAELAASAVVLEKAPEMQAEQGIVTGEMPLTPIQTWFFEQDVRHVHHWNQSVMLAVREELDTTALTQAFAALPRQHDALRLRFQQVNGTWQAAHGEIADEDVLLVADLSSVPEAEREARMRHITDELQASLDIEKGPLHRAAYFQLGAEQRLFIVIHHLVVDGVSWRIILEDLQTAYEQVKAGQKIAWPQKTTSFKSWAEELTTYAEQSAVDEYWTGMDSEQACGLPVDHPQGTNTEGLAVQVKAKLSADETRALLQEVPAAYRTQINDVLLSALTRTITDWTNKRALYVSVEGHGREPIVDGVDVSRTVGWFTSLYPVLLETEPDLAWGDLLKSIKEQVRAIPDKGIGYGIHRYLSRDGQTAEMLRAKPQPEISFNYLGQFGQGQTTDAALFQIIPNWSASNVSEDETRLYKLDVMSMVAQDQLEMSWTFSRDLYEPGTIEKLAHDYVQALRAIIAHCRTEQAGGYTPSDFPLAELDQNSLDKFIGHNRLIENVYTLTPLQEGMLFHSLYEQAGGDYVVQLALKLEHVNVEAFSAAWQKVVERHAILRTSFLWSGLEKPHQVVHAKVKTFVERLDWRHLTAAEQEAGLQTYLEQDRKRGFDLARPPLMRWTLIRLDASTFQFVWSFHHMLLDGWSTPIVFQDWQAFYAAASHGKEASLPAIPPFSAYIAWLKRQNLEEAQQYWRDYLQGFGVPTPLGMGKSGGSAGQPKEYADHKLLLSERATANLLAFARKHQLTLNTVVQGAWALILARYAGEAEVVFGTTNLGRPTDLPDAEAMVGLFINTLPVRVLFPEQTTVIDWLQSLQQAQSEMRQYEFTPLVDIQSWSEVPRGQSLFDSIFVFENYLSGTSADSESGMLLGEVKAVEQTSYPLTLVVAPGEELMLKLIYETGRFEQPAMDKVLAQLSSVLEAIMREPHEQLADLSIITEAERHKLLVQWNATDMPYERNLVMHQLFEAQVEATPDAQALVVGTERLTYAELNKRANQLAHYLRSQGVGPEVLVAVLMERTAEMIVALLGIIKAGGAYVPIDPAYPQNRIGYTLEDSQAAIVLTQERLLPMLPEHTAQVICLDRDWACMTLQPEANVPNLAAPTNLSYVIYTSGSTGLPKGVAIQHSSVIAFIFWAKTVFSAEEMSGVLASTSICFDLSVYEIFVTLSCGGKVILADNALHLPSLPAAKEVTLINTVPSAAKELVRMNAIPPSVRVVNLAGEPLPNTLAQSLYALGHVQKVFNLYGPSEDTTYSTYVQVTKGAKTEPTIGRPLANTQAYVLDAKLQPVPLGLPGELYLGGDGLARGYLKRPKMTAERFLPNPFHPDPHARMYSTGDLVRYLPDGQLEYLGRIDHQVKIRGYRIELGELEAVLRSHPQIKEAVVVAKEDKLGEKRLVAYITTKDGECGDRAVLTSWAKAKLPEFMVPSFFVWLDAMPLTPNGKIDRKQLPEPEWGQVASAAGYVAPRNQTEVLVASIWADVLGIEQVGVHDNFFELGGHSLLATRVASRLRETFAKEVPIRAIFERPTVAELSETLGAIGQNETEAQMLPVSREAHLPLSFAQQRLWFLDRLMPDSTLYNIPSAVRLLGDLDIAAWEKSLQVLIQRHESLRTTFGDVDGEAVQVIHSRLDGKLNVIDLRGMPADEREAEAHRLAGLEAATPFDLSQGPLLRTTLIRLAEQECVFLFNLHHIIFDGWSIGIFLKEMRALYEAFVREEAPELAEITVQYADYAVWQRKWLEGKVLAEQLAYWKEKLSGAEPLLALPTDQPRPAVQTHDGAMHTIKLSGELYAKLNKLSQEEGATLFMTLLAAFQVLLYRYSGQEDILVGSPVAGRNRQETEPLIGFFINTLVLRTDLSGEPTFRELLARVRETAFEAYAHQDLPFEKLVDELELERSLSYSPLFQVMFVLQNFQLNLDEKAGIRVADFEMDKHLVTSKYDLTLTMAEKQNGLFATFEYNTALFHEATMERLSQHFVQLLEAIVHMPDQGIARLPLLNQSERAQLLVEWNDTTTAYPRNKRVDQLFRETALLYPERLAVVAGNQTLTYAELERRANQTANYLQQKGVRPGALVGLCVKRSPEMLIGMLGILKAGGAYVPLDPDYPEERLAYMMGDAGITVLLTQEQLMPGLPSGERTTIALDRDWPLIAKESEQAPDVDTTAESLAYVIYTSGSTGLPKGTLVVHRGIVRLVKETDYVTITEQDVFLQASTVSFDAATFEIWGSLLNGAKLVLLPPELPSLAEIGQAIQSHHVTTLWLTAGLFTLMVDHHKEYLSGVRQLLVGGDIVSVPHVKKALEIAGLTVINGYGPTENTTFTCCNPVTIMPESAHTFPIGRPIKNTTAYVLDRHMQPVPIGVTGELYIGGDGLAEGYLNRPDLTAERFVPNPFATDQAARLYRTGDLVRYLPDGLIEFIGRLDNQVKIRGFRIELSEVEAVLAKHPAITASVVIVHENEAGMKQLVAYAVKDAEQELGTAELRQHFKAHVPDYMVPAAFVMLDALPLTPNGKVDRKALPAPVLERSREEDAFAAATSHVEQTLADIWCAVLRMDRIGIHDNFFELGGDSILSIQIVARANKAGIHLTPKQLFDQQTIAELAKVAGQSTKVDAEQGNVTGEVPLLPIQTWFFEQEQPTPHHWNQSMLLQVNEPLEEEYLSQAVAQLLAHHDALRLRYTFADGQWKQTYADVDSEVPLQVEDLSMSPPAQQARKIEKLAQQAQASLDLQNGPLLKAVYFDLGYDRPGRLLMVIHHLAVDGVSWRILIEDLQTAYGQAEKGNKIQLPPKTTSYKAWAEKLHKYASSERMLVDQDYWLKAADELAGHPLPVHDWAENTEANGRMLTIHLEEEETDALLQKVPSRYRVQINDILLTALALAYGKWTGESALLVNLEGHGREELFEDVDLSRTIGWFTSMYPLLIQLEPNTSSEDALARVKEKLQQIPHKGLGYGLLRYMAQDPELVEKLKAIPQAPLSFNYLGQFHQAADAKALLAYAEGERGANSCPDNRRTHLIDVVGAVTEGKLGLSFLYNGRLYSESHIETFARHYTDALQSLIQAEKQSYRAEDFEDADLSQSALNKVLARLKNRKGNELHGGSH